LTRRALSIEPETCAGLAPIATRLLVKFLESTQPNPGRTFGYCRSLN
jgi:hypothetical protein